MRAPRKSPNRSNWPFEQGTSARARLPRKSAMGPIRRRIKDGYDGVEHVFGVITPLLSALSLLDVFGLLAWTWLLLFWLSCGHWAIYFYDAYPALRHRPFVRGLFAFGVGLLWPVWLAARRPARNIR